MTAPIHYPGPPGAGLCKQILRRVVLDGAVPGDVASSFVDVTCIACLHQLADVIEYQITGRVLADPLGVDKEHWRKCGTCGCPQFLHWTRYGGGDPESACAFCADNNASGDCDGFVPTEDFVCGASMGEPGDTNPDDLFCALAATHGRRCDRHAGIVRPEEQLAHHDFHPSEAAELEELERIVEEEEDEDEAAAQRLADSRRQP